MATDRPTLSERPSPAVMQETFAAYLSLVVDRVTKKPATRLAALACVFRPFEGSFDICGASEAGASDDPEGWDHAFLDDAHARPEDRRSLAWLTAYADALTDAEGKEQKRLYEELVESLSRALAKVQAAHASIEDAFVLADEDDGDVKKARARFEKLKTGKLKSGWAKL